MEIIAAFTGMQELGQKRHCILARTDPGMGFVPGIRVSLMALTFDLRIMKLATDKKRALGLPSGARDHSNIVK